MAARIVLALILVVLVGCATQRGSDRFPSQAELEQIPPLAEARSLALAERKDVSAWDLEGPLPEADAQSVTGQSSPWAQELELASLAHPAHLIRTRAMECAARELGRFFLEHGGQPAQGLKRYILSLCGSVALQVNTAFLHGTVPYDVPTERLFNEWRPQVSTLIASILNGRPHDRAGIWFGQANGQAVVMVVAGESRADFTALPRVPDSEGRVRIQGRLKLDAESVNALVNHGRFGVEDCESDPGVSLPRFALSCPVAQGDSHAWISIAAYPPGRILGERILDLLVWPSGVRSARYERPARPSSEPVATAEQAPEVILRMLNQVRREAGLPTLELAREQSELAHRLAPIYLLAMMGEEPLESADKIALGMMAGWEVPGIVRHGRVTGDFATQTRDVGDLLAATLEHPNGRYALLDPMARAIAIGPVAQAEGELTVIGALVGTYALFDEDEDHGRAAEIVFEELVQIAQEHGVRDVAPSEELTDIASKAARAIREGEWSPERALDSALGIAAGRRPGDPVTGLYLEASDLDQVTFPEEFFEFGSMQVGIAVTHYRPHDSAWGRYVVLVVAAGKKPLLTASVR